jgi:DinB superfamily
LTTSDAGASSDATNQIDLRTTPIESIRASALRSTDRDFWADEVVLWERLQTAWTGLDDAAWHTRDVAPSDAGGPPWSLAEHVGHIADWQELAVDYTARAIETGQWPSANDYDNGNFDTFNEGRREPWASMPRDEIVGRLEAARRRLIEVARRLPPETIRGDDAWEWVYPALHGHYLDHLAVIEPWATRVRDSATAG